MDHTNLYPVFLNIAGKRCLIAGGGSVAARKASGLAGCGARVVVVSPEAHQQLEKMVDDALIKWHRKRFEESDLENVFLVFAATDDPAENKRIAALCAEHTIPVNVADSPGQSVFHVPSVLRRGPVTVAVSTGGESPLLAQRLCSELEDTVSPAHGELAAMLGDVRRKLKNRSSSDERRKAYTAILDSGVFELLGKGRRTEAEELIEQCISSVQD